MIPEYAESVVQRMVNKIYGWHTPSKIPDLETEVLSFWMDPEKGAWRVIVRAFSEPRRLNFIYILSIDGPGQPEMLREFKEGPDSWKDPDGYLRNLGM